MRNAINKLHFVVNGQEFSMWQEKGVVYQQKKNEDSVVINEFGNTKQGRLESGAYMSGILEGVKLSDVSQKPVWDYEELMELFNSMGDKRVSEESTEYHEIHTFSFNGEVGKIYIPQYNSNEPFGWSFSNDRFEEVKEDKVPKWFSELVANTKRIMQIN